MWITVSCCVVDVTGVGWAARSSIVQGHRGQSFKVNLTHKIDQFFNIYIINKPKQKKWWRFGEERMGNACWSFLEMALDSMTPAHHFPTTKTPKKYRKFAIFRWNGPSIWSNWFFHSNFSRFVERLSKFGDQFGSLNGQIWIHLVEINRNWNANLGQFRQFWSIISEIIQILCNNNQNWPRFWVKSSKFGGKQQIYCQFRRNQPNWTANLGRIVIFTAISAVIGSIIQIWWPIRWFEKPNLVS